MAAPFLGVRLLAVIALSGCAAGLGGVALTLLLHAIQHLAYGYTENTFLLGVQWASPLRRVLAMTLGGLLVGLGWWALGTRPPTVREVLQSRRLPLGRAVADSALQIAAVAFGASLGREGAPRQVGAALSARLARRAGVSPSDQRIVLACGAGAGLAAVYNVPLGGALYALEVLLLSLSRREVICAVLASAIATAIAWPVLSNHPTYDVPELHLHAPVLAWAVLFGPVAGVAGAGFMRLMELAQRHRPAGWRLPVATTVGFALVGLLAAPFPALLGNGKGPAQLSFEGTPTVGLLLTLALLKPVATAICLRSGAAGGLLTPALATGALLGSACGIGWSHLWPGSPPAVYAIIGAASLLATTLRAPFTAIALVIELTHTGETLLVPVMLAVALATVTSRTLPSWTGLGAARTTT